MKQVAALAFLFALTAAAPPQPLVEVASGDWAGLPKLEFVGYDHLTGTALQKIYEIGRSHQCRLPGQSGNHIDFAVTFAAQFAADGNLSRLVLPRLNCPPAEAWFGGVVTKAIQSGDYRRREENPEGWYRGDFRFYYEG